ncbi:Peptidyl-prolyl cis-trans isomerase FKBP62, partial [Bienertia sinuspersici]
CENLKDELRGILLEGSSLEEEDMEEVNEFLEKYRFTGVFLTCLEASNSILNVAMCFLKKKEFMHAGQIYTMVLNFSSQNVKALFRKALAVIELGRHDLAFWDMCLASEVEHLNQGVEKKLNHVKNLLHNPSIELAQETSSVDLDLNPPLPRNSSVGRILKEKGKHVVYCEVGVRNDKKSNKRKFINQDVVVNGLLKGDSGIKEGN